MRHLLLTLTILFSSVALSAATAQFKRIWIETNVEKDGERGLMIHADFDLNGAKDKIVQCQAIFYATPGGRALRDINDRYRLSPSLNYVSSSAYMKAKTNAMDIEDMEVFIPADELHLKNQRKYRIYVKMSIYTDPGKTGEFLAESDYIPFLIDMSDLQCSGERFDYDPTKPVVIPELPKVKQEEKPAVKKEQQADNDEPKRDKKGRIKPKKGKVFIS